MRPPGAPLGEVAELVRLSGATSRRTHPVPPPPPQVLHAIEACRRAPLGGHAAHDPPWGFERYASNAWRHRPWPTCQTFPTGQWGADRPAAWRPGPAGPLVFPVPHALHPRLLAPQRPLFTLLGHAARHPRVPFGHRHRGGPIGCPRVRQPWAHPLGAHGHVHCRMAAGALAAASTRGMAADPRCLLPVRAVRPVCRGTFCEARRPGGATATTLRRQGLPALGTPADGKPLRAQLDAKDWVVSAKAPLAGPAHVLDEVGRSTHRVARAHHRLRDVRDGWGRCASRRRRQGQRVQTRTRDADAFIRRFLFPVLPRGFRRLRPSGFLAHRHKAQPLSRCRELLGQPSTLPPRSPKNVVQWLHEVTGIDLTPCPPWGARPLVRLPLPPLSPPAVRQGVPLEPPRFAASSSWG
jgi:hypothetical protein